MSAGESAVAMATQLEEQADALREQARRWRAGAEGEQRVEATLRDAALAGLHVLHDRLLRPGESETNLDRVVVCTAGIVVIDAKNWVGSVNGYHDSLWQHWSGVDGRRSENKIGELRKVRWLTSRVAAHAA